MSAESESVEFKPSLSQTDKIVESVSAFSTTKGGRIEMGKDDKDGSVLGVTIGKRTVENLANDIKQNTDPPVFPSIEVVKMDGKDVIVISIEESRSKPVLAYGRAFKRVGKTNQRIGYEEIRKLVAASSKIYWDERICEGAAIKDIDGKKVKWFLRKAKAERNLGIDPETPINEAFEKLKLMRDGKITNACALLFSKEREFLQSEVKCIRFSGNEPIKPYIDFQTLEGSIFDLIDKAEDFVLRNVRRAIWLVPGKAQREEKLDYPPDAIREAIANAIAHRDYESPSNVQIRIFDDSIEIWNPGKLPEGWTVKKLKEKHESVPRNPLLFKQLFWVKYVEDVGGGTLDIIKECSDWGIPEPDFEDTGTSIIVTFRKPSLSEEYLTALGLNERQKKALNYVKERGRVTNREYRKINKVSNKTAYADLQHLIDKGILFAGGSGKYSYYAFTDTFIKGVPKVMQEGNAKVMQGNNK